MHTWQVFRSWLRHRGWGEREEPDWGANSDSIGGRGMGPGLADRRSDSPVCTLPERFSPKSFFPSDIKSQILLLKREDSIWFMLEPCFLTKA